MKQTAKFSFMKEYDRIQIQEVCSKICSGGTPKSTVDTYYGGGIPWLNTKEVNFNRIHSTEKTITEEGLQNSSAKWIDENAVIVAMYGATAGKSAISKIRLTTNQACCNLNIDPDKADYRFVYYALYNDYNRLASLANGGAQQNLNAMQIKEFDIPYPSLEEQTTIANFLSALDDKIELNRQINDNLEQQAQAIYKSWFIDFEPFKDGEFVESEIGLIPEGWKVGTLSDLAEITMGQSPSGKSYNECGEGILFYQGRAEFGDRYPSIRLYTTEPSRIADQNSVLLSVRAPVGDTNIAYNKCCIGRGLASIKAKHGFNSFIFYMIKSMKDQFDMYNGEGTVFGSINRDSLNSLNVIVPTNDVINKFEKIVAPLDLKYKSLFTENLLLTQQRDTLLPKLMSGELKINELDC